MSLKQGQIIQDKYKIDSKISSGAFGSVYKALNIKENKFVALKLEKIQQNCNKTQDSLNYEYQVYQNLQKKPSLFEYIDNISTYKQENNNNTISKKLLRHSNSSESIDTNESQSPISRQYKQQYMNTNIIIQEKKPAEQQNDKDFAPQMHEYFQFQDHACLVLDLLGDSLEKKLQRCQGSFSVQTVCKLAMQILEKIEQLHSKNYLHRDIKPENFMLNSQNSDEICLADFGLSKKFVEEDGSHTNFTENNGLVGTPRYASICTHLGFQQGRRDDLESIGYLFAYLLKGDLPWHSNNIQGWSKMELEQQIEEIKNIKIETSSEELFLCYPKCFVKYLDYCKNLQFEEKPDYEFLRGLFSNLYEALDDQSQKFEYDWNLKN